MQQRIFKYPAIALIICVTVVVWIIGPAASGKTRSENPNVALEPGETGTVSFVIDGDGFVLEGGLKVQLAGIEAPQRAWPEQDLAGFPLADEAQQYLQQLVKGKTVKLFYGGKTRDRFDRALAQVWLVDETGEKQQWLQETVLSAGYARVYTWPDTDVDVTSFYLAEQAARKARRGIWNNRRTKSFYKIRKPDPNPLAQYVDSLQVVEGVVVSTTDVRGTVFLNFGSDYKTDFTVGVSKKRVKAFQAQGIDPLKLEGARIRVRGWLELQNGPIIWANDPRRIEIVN